jgi:hypothetical protein
MQYDIGTNKADCVTCAKAATMAVSWMFFAPSDKLGAGLLRNLKSRTTIDTKAPVPRQNVNISHRQCHIEFRGARGARSLLSCAGNRDASVVSLTGSGSYAPCSVGSVMLPTEVLL